MKAFTLAPTILALLSGTAYAMPGMGEGGTGDPVFDFLYGPGGLAVLGTFLLIAGLACRGGRKEPAPVPIPLRQSEYRRGFRNDRPVATPATEPRWTRLDKTAAVLYSAHPPAPGANVVPLRHGLFLQTASTHPPGAGPAEDPAEILRLRRLLSERAEELRRRHLSHHQPARNELKN